VALDEGRYFHFVLAEVLEQFAIGVAVHRVDGVLVAANAAAREFVGLEIVHRCIAEARRHERVGIVAVEGVVEVCSFFTGSIIVTAIARPGQTGTDAAASLYGLTATEQRIVGLLARGCTARGASSSSPAISITRSPSSWPTRCRAWG
jgi:PAS domain-containing protein